MDALLTRLREGFSADLFIYIMMAVLLLTALFNHRGKGLINLFWISLKLNKAAKDLRHPAIYAKLRSNILEGKTDEAAAFFSTKSLKKQLLLYAENIRSSRVTSAEQCQLDIGMYFNVDLLELEGNRSFQEHATVGMNALGILGTFLGLILGLQNFRTDNAATTSESIKTLMGGMGTAFNTSLIGVSLSLIYGIIFRAAFGRAEKKLNLFLEEFRRYVLSDQRQSSINQVVDRLIKLENQVSLNSEEHRSEVDTMARALVEHMGECLTEQVDEMRRTIEATTARQAACNEKIGEMIVQLDVVKDHIIQLSSSFSPVIDQSRLLAEQMTQAAHAVQMETHTISEIVNADSAILEKQQQVAQKLDNYAAAMGSLSMQVAQQSSKTAESINQVAQCSQSVILDSQTALDSQLRAIMLAACDVSQELANQSMRNIEVMQQHMEQMIQRLPARSEDSSALQTLVRQNNKMIENQQRLLDALRHGSVDTSSCDDTNRKWPKGLKLPKWR